MQLIKYCMLFFVFLIVTLIGKNIAQKYRLRLEELEEIKNALNIFKSKIKFTYEPIPEIFKQISENSNKNISQLFLKSVTNMENASASIAWEEAVDSFSGNINKEDKQAIKTLSKLLRNNRCRWTAKPNRSNRNIFRRTNIKCTRRKK